MPGRIIGFHREHRSIKAMSVLTAAFMQEFFSRTGNTKLKFKPAFNPYTEVSHFLWLWSSLHPFSMPVIGTPDFRSSL
jgi:hypothetical protein